MNADGELLWSIPKLSAQIGLGKTKIYDLFAQGKLRPVRVGRRTLVPVAEVRRWLEALCAGEG